MLKKQFIKRYFVLLVALLLAISSFQPTPVLAEANKEGPLETTYSGEGYHVVYKVTSNWTGSFNANVTIQNTSDKPIDNWAISFLLPYEITNIWNGIVKSHENGLYVIKNAGSNQDIAVGGSISFGFTSKYDGELLLPSLFDLLGTDAVVPLEQFEVNFTVTSDWKDAFNGEIRIKNISQETIEDWKLQFEYDSNIDRFWTAEITEHTGNRYIIKNQGYNANIKPGETVTLGFTGKPGNAVKDPANYQLSQVAMKQDIPVNVHLQLDTSGLQHQNSADGEFYFLTSKMDKLFGTLVGTSQVVQLTYEISNRNKTVINQGTISAADSWSVENIGFGMGYNLLKLSAKLINGVEVNKEYIIVNFDKSNLDTIGIDQEKDSDGDGIPDYYEQQFNLSIDNEDTDEDGLRDLDELIALKTNPLIRDSDKDGILDGNEDNDGDQLDNLTEMEINTSFISNDTDSDGLLDGKEVLVHKTEPLNVDTDGDGLSDGWEDEIGSNPLVFDDKFTRTIRAENESAKTIPSVTVKGISTEHVDSLVVYEAEDGILDDTTIPGYIDNGYEFSIDGDFEKATITFEFDESLLSTESFAPRIYYFNEKTQLFEELPNQQVVGNMVSVETTHFSKYILLNKTEYDKVWLYEFLYDDSPEEQYSGLDIAFVIDSSGSMTSNDRNNVRINVTREFINKLSENDRGAVIDFDSRATILSNFSSDKKSLNDAAGRIDSSGGTSLTSGISSALTLFAGSERANVLKYIIMLTDGEGSYNTSLTAQAAKNNIVIYTVGLGSSVSQSVLSAMASGTGGGYYHASNANQLYGIFDSIAETSDLYKDTDTDGISDYHEKEMQAGRLRLGTGGALIKINYLDEDGDDDGLKDGEEIRIVKVGNKVYASLYSNPNLLDTDGDDLHDSLDSRRLIPDDVEALIHQSTYREGILKGKVEPDRTVSDDLTFNDYTYNELLDLGFVFSVAGVTPEFMMWGELADVFAVGKFRASSDMKDVLDDLLSTFRNGNRSNEGTTVSNGDEFETSKYIKYKDTKLDNEVINDPSTKKYVDLTRDFVVEQLRNNDGNLSLLEYVPNSKMNVVENYMMSLSESPYPKFTEKTNLALALAIHGFHGHNISIKNFKNDGGQFSGTLVFHFYDHFGLDADDEINHYGFVDWFTLQHYDRFNGKYAPYITTIDYEMDFSGTLK